MNRSQSHPCAEEGPTASLAPTQHSGGLAALLERVEAAEGPDRELDLAVDIWAQPQNWSSKVRSTGNAGCPAAWFNAEELPEYTASLDAALALVERLGFDLPQFLHETMEDMANGGWRDDHPIIPQMALYTLARMLREKIAREADDAS